MFAAPQTGKNDPRLFPKPLDQWRQPAAPANAAPTAQTAQQQPAAGPTIRVEFEGRIHEFPADFTDDEISQALDQISPRPAPQSPGQPQGRQRVEFEGKIYDFPADAKDDEIAAELDKISPWQPSPAYQDALGDTSATTQRFDSRPPDAMRDAAYVGQRANRGLADVAGAPVDLMAGALNVGAFSADKLAQLFGGSFPYRVEKPVMGSDWIADKAAQGYEAAGGNVVDRDDVSPAARIGGEATRFGVGALIPSAGLASRTGQALAQSEGIAGRILGPLAAPYRNSPAPMIGDAAAGLGAGAASSAYDESAPDSVKDFLGPLGPLAAALIGGVGGASLQSTAAGVGDLAKNTARNIISGKGDPLAPVNPVTGKRAFSRSEMDEAARAVQSQASNPKTAAANIRDNIDELRSVAANGELPTSGAVSEDTGLALLEREMRSKNPRPFIERDQAVNSRAGAIIADTAPQGSAPRDFTESADALQRGREDAARANVDTARSAEADASDALRRLAEPVAAGAGQGVPSSQKLDEALTAGSLRPMQARKNEAFAAIDPNRTVVRDAQPLIDAAQSIRDGLGRLNDPSSILPTRTLDRIAGLATEAGGQGTITFGEINALRPELSAALVKAQQTGDFALADNIKRLQAAVNRETDLLAAEGTPAGQRAADAQRIYKEEFAPVWNVGPGDEATRFRRDFNADRDGRTLSPPSATAGRFLRAGQPEKAESLRRIMETLPDKAAAQGEARRYLISDLAESGVMDTKTRMLRYDALRRWRNQWGDALDVVPGLKSEIDTLIGNVSKGSAQQGKLLDDLRAAETKLDDVSKNRGALGLVLGKDPLNAVGSVFGAPDSEGAMKAIVRQVKSNDRARDGLKAAVADFISHRTSSAAVQKTADGARPIDFARLENLFNRYEKTLAAVYSPAEMNALRQAHKLLKPQNAIKVPAGGASFADTRKAEHAWRLLEGGLKARYGVLKGGGMLRTIRIFVSTLPNSDDAIQNIITRMHFDPDLAVHLLGRDVPVDSPAWNAKLNRLLALAAGGRESGSVGEGGDGEKPGRLEITVDKANGQGAR